MVVAELATPLLVMATVVNILATYNLVCKVQRLYFNNNTPYSIAELYKKKKKKKIMGLMY